MSGLRPRHTELCLMPVWYPRGAPHRWKLPSEATALDEKNWLYLIQYLNIHIVLHLRLKPITDGDMFRAPRANRIEWPRKPRPLITHPTPYDFARSSAQRKLTWLSVEGLRPDAQAFVDKVVSKSAWMMLNACDLMTFSCTKEALSTKLSVQQTAHRSQYDDLTKTIDKHMSEPHGLEESSPV
ncbi:uncharacterized protein B0I36DRAFT_344522 [Microdochium trichocladiopsis]|uniref:Uncharacterized protein n=1 Tax=Microdochium trichocladiopsis TaxID=1682393 RepID=A0A9P8YJ33_9PEZI|nr:uncharacterized protein B0I36DRAFT_344522 [Microdochium trichocladiopsis]KAH7040848.1 hypothetical protein B0I36DRAFT_344522 [Microdochium trichocladiopsis]